MESKVETLVKQLNIIFVAMVVGLILLFAVAYFLFYGRGVIVDLDAETNYILSTTGMLLTIGLIPLSYFIFNSRGKVARAEKKEVTKLEIFRTACILRLSLLEVIGMINIVLFMFTGSDQNVIILLIVLLVFFLSKPSVHQYQNDFE